MGDAPCTCHRPLSDAERAALSDLLRTIDAMRTAFMALKGLGWQPPQDTKAWDDARETIRALTSDTRSLMREAGTR